MKMISAILMNLVILTIVTFSGHAEWISNISIGLYIFLSCISVICLYVNPKLKSKPILPNTLSIIFKIYAIVVFIAYGFWIRAILAAIFAICMSHAGLLYKSESSEGDNQDADGSINK